VRPAAGTVALPGRVLGAPFTRVLRARTGNVLDALLSGRGWIALVGILLAGIVFFNVDLLRMNREIAQTAERGAALKRENARLRREAALLGSTQRIQDAAGRLGLVFPAPAQVRYLHARPGMDARRAARRITAPDPSLLAPLPVVAEPLAPAVADATLGTVVSPDATTAPVTTATPAPTDPTAASPPVDPAAAATPVDPVTATPTTPAPTTPPAG